MKCEAAGMTYGGVLTAVKEDAYSAGMTYDEIAEKDPEEFAMRKKNKLGYRYPRQLPDAMPHAATSMSVAFCCPNHGMQHLTLTSMCGSKHEFPLMGPSC
jgi:hypothetical protein